MVNCMYSKEEIPPILVVSEVAQFLGIGNNAVYGLIRSGQLEALRIGRKIKIPRHALLRFMGVQD